MGRAFEADRKFVVVTIAIVIIVFGIGQFGTGPVSYFVFVRFLLLANLLMFLIWFTFVGIPQISWRYNDGQNMILQPARSQLHCLRRCNGSSTCPSGTSTVYSCSLTNESVVINRCTDENCVSDDRPKEDSTEVTVCVNNSGTTAIRYCVFDNVDPEVSGLQWIVDFVTGQVRW